MSDRQRFYPYGLLVGLPATVVVLGVGWVVTLLWPNASKGAGIGFGLGVTALLVVATLVAQRWAQERGELPPRAAGPVRQIEKMVGQTARVVTGRSTDMNVPAAESNSTLVRVHAV